MELSVMQGALKYFAARMHWGVENQLHWRLDVVFNEDGACIRKIDPIGYVDI